MALFIQDLLLLPPFPEMLREAPRGWVWGLGVSHRPPIRPAFPGHCSVGTTAPFPLKLSLLCCLSPAPQSPASCCHRSLSHAPATAAEMDFFCLFLSVSLCRKGLKAVGPGVLEFYGVLSESTPWHLALQQTRQVSLRSSLGWIQLAVTGCTQNYYPLLLPTRPIAFAAFLQDVSLQENSPDPLHVARSISLSYP